MNRGTAGIIARRGEYGEPDVGLLPVDAKCGELSARRLQARRVEGALGVSCFRRPGREPREWRALEVRAQFVMGDGSDSGDDDVLRVHGPRMQAPQSHWGESVEVA